METMVKSVKAQIALNNALEEFNRGGDFEFVGGCTFSPQIKEYNICIFLFNTLKMTEEEYNKWEKLLDEQKYEHEHYIIRIMYDISGYDYCVRIEKENNIPYFQILANDELVESDVKDIIKKIKFFITNIQKF